MKRNFAAASISTGVLAIVLAGVCLLPTWAFAQGSWEGNFDAGRKHLLEGRYPEAEKSLKEALRLAGDDEQLGNTLNELGMCMGRQAKYREAEDYLQRALDKSQGVNRALVMNNLAIVYLDQAMVAKADKLFAKAVEVIEKAGKKEDLAMTLDNVGTAFVLRGHWTKALPYYKRAEKLWEEVGWKHVNAPTVKANLGTLYLSWKNTQQAQEHYQQAIALWEDKGHANHPLQAFPLSCLASILTDQGKLEEAEKLLKRATEIMDKKLAPSHPHRADCLRNWGEFYRRKGDRDQAEVYFKKSLAAWAKNPAKTIRGARTHFFLGRLYADQKKWVEAERCYQQALEDYQKRSAR